jgi:hypothetical protein
MSKAQSLIEVYDNLDWDHYIELCDKILVINKSLLEEELSKSHLIYAYYIGLLNLARTRVVIVEDDLQRIYNTNRASTAKELRASEDKVTEKDIEAKIMSRTDYCSTKIDLQVAQSKENLLKGLFEALKQRHENLIQLSSNSRAEMKINS